MSDRLTSLAAIEAQVWRLLGDAVHDAQHPWRTPVLATVNEDAADARTVVLREVVSSAKQFLIYSDERAGKVAQLLRHPRGTLVMWSAALGWQLRCRVYLTLEMSGLSASSRWARIKLSPSAQDYLSPLAPGSTLDTADAPVQTPVARDYFAVINAQVASIDWLELHASGHRRARFDGDGARWIQP